MCPVNPRAARVHSSEPLERRYGARFRDHVTSLRLGMDVGATSTEAVLHPQGVVEWLDKRLD